MQQVWERGGSLEIAVAQRSEVSGLRTPQLVWRVRLMQLNDAELLVEQPSALGTDIAIHTGVELVVVMCIGQNRWMFTTRVLGMTTSQSHRSATPWLRLAMPSSVERCQRRQHDRLETASLHLPEVELWPLLDPKSVLLAERACQLGSAASSAMASEPGAASDLIMPEVGPRFTATLVNLGGGGVGLRVSPDESQSLTRHKIFWLRLQLPPEHSTPICASGKLAHTHMESNHDVYAGMAFDFSFNPGHQQFVVDQINRYIAAQQRHQLQLCGAGA